MIRTEVSPSGSSAEAMAHAENRCLRPPVSDQFSLTVNFDNVLSVFTKNSDSIIRSGSQALHRSFPPPTSSPWYIQLGVRNDEEQGEEYSYCALIDQL